MGDTQGAWFVICASHGHGGVGPFLGPDEAEAAARSVSKDYLDSFGQGGCLYAPVPILWKKGVEGAFRPEDQLFDEAHAFRRRVLGAEPNPN